MSSSVTSPLTPESCDLRDFPRMSIDVTRLFGSSFNAQASTNPIAWMVGHKLWYRSWHQVPAASLPDDEAELCHLAELGFDLKTFRKVRAVAMRNWVKASDGRFYHPVIAEMALISWLEKLLQRLKSGLGNAKRWKAVFDASEIEAQIREAAVLLAALNPRAPVLGKESVVRALGGVPLGYAPSADAGPVGDPSGIATGTPSGMHEGREIDPMGNPSAFPQAIPRERERERESEPEEVCFSPHQQTNPTREELRPIQVSTGSGLGAILAIGTADADPKPKTVKLDNVTPEERAGFEAWWQVYPHKVSKQDAMLAFVRVERAGDVSVDHLTERAMAYARWLTTTDTKPANAATWLNGRRWEDELKFHARPQPRGQWSSMDDALVSTNLEE